MANKLTPPPPTGTVLDRWLALLYQNLTAAGQVLWSSVSKVGANLTDLETRDHVDLQNKQGGTTAEYYHLTSAEYTGTGTGNFVRAASPTVTAPTISSGNLTFSGTGQRLTGDMTNATLTSRFFLQNSVANGNSLLPVIPNGTSVVSGLHLYGNSDPTNSSRANIAMVGGSEMRLSSDATGTGAFLPLVFWTNNTEVIRFTTAQHTELQGTLKTKGYTVATLPAAGTAGRETYVTNALAPVWGAAAAGGGAVLVGVLDNGTAWVCA